jgi:hypothetical protein
MDGWTDSNGASLPSDWKPGKPLAPAGEWTDGCGCAPPDGPSIADSVVITGSPGAITSVQNDKALWALVLNDGTPAADFRIDRFDAGGVLVDSPMTIVRATGVVSFHDPVMLDGDPVQPLEAATKQYVDDNAGGIPDAPSDNTTYGRDNGAWVPLPASYMPEAPNTSTRFGRFNSTWQPDAIQTDAPNDGGAYARQSAGWTPAVTGGPYLPLAGGTVTGVLNLPPNNQVYINGILGSTANLIGQKAGLARWSLALGDSATEGAGNAGCNIRLDAYGAAGGYIGTPLTITRNGDFNITGSMAINGPLALQGVGSFILPGGSAGQVLSTNGSGVLSWATPTGGGIPDAPNDGTLYGRGSISWRNMTHNDITDWAPALAPYALTASVPVASNTAPIMDGTASSGTGITWSRADHVHPSDTSKLNLSGGTLTGRLFLANDPAVTAPLEAADQRYVVSNVPGENKLINGDMWLDARNGGAAVNNINPRLYSLDRWIMNGAASTVFSAQRLATGGPAGFPYFVRLTGLSTFTAGSGDYNSFSQIMEADVVADMGFGAAGASFWCLSFWVRASVGGAYSGSITNAAGTRSYPFNFTVSAVNTWQKITIQNQAGDTAGTWVGTGNAAAMSVRFDLGCGATFRSTAGTWQAGNFIGVTGAQSIAFTAGRTLDITGIKFETGAFCTPYLRQTLAKTTNDCARYYQKIFAAGRFAASAGGQTSENTVGFVVMRATPTAVLVTAGSRANLNASFPQLIPMGGNSARFAVASAAAGDCYALSDFWSLDTEL